MRSSASGVVSLISIHAEAGFGQIFHGALGELGAFEPQHRDHALRDQGLPKSRLGIHSTIPGMKMRRSVSPDTAIRKGIDSRV